MKKTIQIQVRGIVQQVGYRNFSKQKADELQITGSAQNLKDGSVEIYACGEEDKLECFLSALKIGPQKAKVEGIHFHVVTHKQLKTFEILQ
ncbi:acylphosphatase [Helicobacter sp. 11S03491-1]|uniref:acylphosphatase n=1 Tax=Helicobacter sp. 11S03491-1 TaxID=1476196 RepID=UPI000BA5F861|nr:acylphosphatase [Helicobacter sp. 11S03491-1]PAF43872.1 hypothetical protein BKH45_01005 [Helicobacter sp. 11S03491-1]